MSLALDVNKDTTYTNINTIFSDTREDLLYENNKNTHIEVVKCPEIELEIENIKLNALIDSGSQITCLSLDFYNRNLKILKKMSNIAYMWSDYKKCN